MAPRELQRQLWKPALRRASRDSGFGMHACRHTYANILIARQNALVVMARLGHASITGHRPAAHMSVVTDRRQVTRWRSQDLRRNTLGN